MRNARNALVLRELKSELYSERPLPCAFKRFVDLEVVPSLRPPKYKRDRWRQTVQHCVHCLLTAGLRNRCIADARDYHATPRMRIACWDELVRAGWGIEALGSESSAKVTRYGATAHLLERRRLWELEALELPEIGDLVLLKTGKHDWRTGEVLANRGYVSIRERVELTAERTQDGTPDPSAVRNGLMYLSHIESLIDRLNTRNLQHSWLAFRTIEGVNGKARKVAFQPSVTLKQIHSGQLFRAARLYTTGPVGVQSMSSEQRASMLIDSEPVVELDFSCCHLRMLYHLLPKRYRELESDRDLYQPQRIFPRFYRSSATHGREPVREFIKHVVNIMLNTGDRNDARGAVIGELNRCSREVREVIFQVEKSGPDDVLARIERTHPMLTSHGKFYSNAACDLMTADGSMMLHILLRFADAGKPAASVHDSLIVRASDESFARRVMASVYGEFFPDCRPLIK